MVNKIHKKRDLSENDRSDIERCMEKIEVLLEKVDFLAW